MSEFELKDSGEREQFGTGAQRDIQTDKPRYDLVPTKALERLAWVYARGAAKYDENNWMKGMPFSRTLASAERHLNDWKQGKTDEDHLAQAAWNLLALLHYESLPQWYGALNDLVDYTAPTLADGLHLDPPVESQALPADEPSDEPFAPDGAGDEYEIFPLKVVFDSVEDRHQRLSDPLG